MAGAQGDHGGPEGISEPPRDAPPPHVPPVIESPTATRRKRRRRNETAADLLRHHGDAEVAQGLTDLAVNVRRTSPPVWLQEAILRSLKHLARYPNPEVAQAALAELHGVPYSSVLVTNGATEAFTLLARTFPPEAVDKVAIVHPQFSEPERAALAAGHNVVHVMCRQENEFRLDPSAVPDDAGLVLIGNPTNPTGVLHPAQQILSLLRPGRVVVVDEAFMDAIPDEKHSVLPHQLPGLVVVRSLTKSWGLAGLRVGYAVGDPDVISGMAHQQPPWSVNALALAATIACTSEDAIASSIEQAERIQSDVQLLTSALRLVSAEFHGIYVPGQSQAPFALVRVSYGQTRRMQMRAKGWAIRGCASFPGLGEDWWRVASRDNDTTMRFLADLKSILAPQNPPTIGAGERGELR